MPETNETTTTTETEAPKVNKSKRFFNIGAAAAALSEFVPEGAAERLLEAQGVVADGDYVEHYLRSCGIGSQTSFAAQAINLTWGEGGKLTGDQLTRILVVAFPNANIGDRHGKHYLSYARTGKIDKLPGLRDDLPVIPMERRARAKKKGDPEVPVAEGDQPAITAELLLKDNDRKVLVEMAKGMGVKASGKSAEIAQRIADFMNAPAAAEATSEEAAA